MIDFGDIRDVDFKRPVEIGARGVRRPDGHRSRCTRLEIEAGGSDPEFVAGDRKLRAVASGNNAVGEGVVRVHIRGSEHPDHRIRRVLRHRVRG